MADKDFREALRRWYSEGTYEAQEHVIALALRQEMDIWDIFRFILNNKEDIPLHQAIFETIEAQEGLEPKIARALDLLAKYIAPLDANAFSEGMWSTGEDDEYGYAQYIHGKQFRIGFVDWTAPGEEYIIEDETKSVYHKAENQITPVTCEDIINEIRDQNIQDALIHTARKHLAKLAAGGDPIIAGIFSIHIQFNGGEIDDPLILENIPFWQVGRNSTHGFYLGVKDGQRYRMSEYWDWDKEEGDRLEQQISPVDDFSGYIGHF